jgi:uncharacterized protein YqeY
MTLEQLRKDRNEAMKAKDTLKKDTLSAIIGAIDKTAIDRKCKDNITEALVDEVLLKELKTVKEMIDTCPLDRVETRQEYTARYNIVASYAPQMLTEGEVLIEFMYWAEQNSIELVKANRSVIMKGFMPLMKGRADGKLVNEIITEVLK